MTAVSWVLAVLLTVGVAGLAVVPYFRALPTPGRLVGRPDEVRRQIDQELARRYCRECGVPFERDGGSHCESCGAERPGHWS